MKCSFRYDNYKFALHKLIAIISFGFAEELQSVSPILIFNPKWSPWKAAWTLLGTWEGFSPFLNLFKKIKVQWFCQFGFPTFCAPVTHGST